MKRIIFTIIIFCLLITFLAGVNIGLLIREAYIVISEGPKEHTILIPDTKAQELCEKFSSRRPAEWYFDQDGRVICSN